MLLGLNWKAYSHNTNKKCTLYPRASYVHSSILYKDYSNSQTYRDIDRKLRGGFPIYTHTSTLPGNKSTRPALKALMSLQYASTNYPERGRTIINTTLRIPVSKLMEGEQCLHLSTHFFIYWINNKTNRPGC